MSVFLIAEAASTHDGSLDKAFRLIAEAKRAGADAVKFQAFKPETLAARRNAADYKWAYDKYELPLAWLPELKARADEHELELLVTVYHEDYLTAVAPYVKRWKVASFEAQDSAFLGAMRLFGKPAIISTGMMDLEAYAKLVGQWPDATRLHCTSAYPAPLAEANLRVLRGEAPYSRIFPAPDGLSDHTRNVLTGAVATAAGASMLEVHFRLDETATTHPDFAVSLSPGELWQYVQNVRTAETLLGDGEKRVMASEGPMTKYRVRG